MKKKKNIKPIIESEGIESQTIDVDSSNGIEQGDIVDVSEIPANTIDEVEYQRYCELKLLTLQGATLKVDKQNYLNDFERKTKDLKGLRAKKTVTAFTKNQITVFIKGIIIPTSIVNRLGTIINYYAE